MGNINTAATDSPVETPVLKNDLLLRALHGEQLQRPPVWMMRQAGRYLPDYQKLKAKYDFFTRVQTPEIACEITLQPVKQIGVDAAILFSDILVIPQAMGMEVQLIESKGPVLPNPVQTLDDVKRLSTKHVAEELHYTFDAIRLINKTLDGAVPLIGFAGAPWTLLCYMVEGKGSKTFDRAKAFCYQQPEAAYLLLDMITDAVIIYLKEQVKAGVHVVQIFDSWAGLLSKQDYETFSLQYIRKIVEAVLPECPMIVYPKGAWFAIKEVAEMGAALGLDWTVEAQYARKQAGYGVTLQGNLDPAKLFAPPAEIKKSVKQMIDAFGTQHYIANLGHGILPGVPVEHAKLFVESVKTYSRS